MGWDPVTAAAERAARFAQETRCFTADADAVRRVPPSPGLHPVRWSPTRTAVDIQLMDRQWRLGSAPPVGRMDAYDAVACTQGSRPLPLILPSSTDLSARFGRGVHWLTWLTTNRPSQQVFSRVPGVDAVLVGA